MCVCVCVCMCVFFSNEASNNLCNVLEAVFLHGVKDNVVTKVLVSFIVINYLMWGDIYTDENSWAELRLGMGYWIYLHMAILLLGL